MKQGRERVMVYGMEHDMKRGMKHGNDDVYDVGRFLEAQDHGVYEHAVAELRAGRKRGHWIWFVFPQVKGLGMSSTANYYGISSWGELRAYWHQTALRQRLSEASQALLSAPGSDPTAILGGIDALKVRSSMTLFELAAARFTPASVGEAPAGDEAAKDDGAPAGDEAAKDDEARAGDDALAASDPLDGNEAEGLFAEVLDRFYGGQRDELTLGNVAGWGNLQQ